MATLRHLPLLGFAFSGLFACSAAVGAPPAGSGGKSSAAGGNTQGTGSGTGSGGFQQGAGGSSFPGAGGAVVGAGGAVVGAGGALVGAGGALVGAGGAVVGAGGAVVGAGGAVSSGPGCSAAAFTVSNKNYADNGTFCGYAWTATNKEGETIDPPCGTGEACFDGELCAEVTIPANDTEGGVYTGVMIGWSIAQSASGTEGTFKDGFTSIKPTFTKTGLTGEVRVLVQSSNKDYCVAAATSGTALSFDDFTEGCWEGGDMNPLPATTPLKAIAIQVNGAATAQTGTLCLTGLTVTP